MKERKKKNQDRVASNLSCYSVLCLAYLQNQNHSSSSLTKKNTEVPFFFFYITKYFIAFVTGQVLLQSCNSGGF